MDTSIDSSGILGFVPPNSVPEKPSTSNTGDGETEFGEVGDASLEDALDETKRTDGSEGKWFAEPNAGATGYLPPIESGREEID